MFLTTLNVNRQKYDFRSFIVQLIKNLFHLYILHKFNLFKLQILMFKNVITIRFTFSWKRSLLRIFLEVHF